MNTVSDFGKPMNAVQIGVSAQKTSGWFGIDVCPVEITKEKILILDFKTGHQAFVRTSNEEFRTVEWREVSGKSSQHSKPTGLGLR